MKYWFLWATLALVLVSCDGKNESSTCHKRIYVKNMSDIPIRVCLITVYRFTDSVICTLSDSKNKIVHPYQIEEVEMAGWNDCLEEEVEWALSHRDSYYSLMMTIFICDTVHPAQTFYSTIDSLLLNHNILGRISLLDIGVDSLKRCDFTFQYPFK